MIAMGGLEINIANDCEISYSEKNKSLIISDTRKNTVEIPIDRCCVIATLILMKYSMAGIRKRATMLKEFEKIREENK